MVRCKFIVLILLFLFVSITSLGCGTIMGVDQDIRVLGDILRHIDYYLSLFIYAINLLKRKEIIKGIMVDVRVDL